uniref:Protein kinase domain-containing protein n=1 Tax=Plectus sambesii TaxID=2011161 RepID=A0A914WRJ6_9BILA
MDQPKAYHKESDIWSLACTLVQMISGESPYKKLTFTDFIKRAEPNSPNPLKYSGDLLPAASLTIQVLLDSLFVTDWRRRSSASDILKLANNARNIIMNEIVHESAPVHLRNGYFYGPGVPQPDDGAGEAREKTSEQGQVETRNEIRETQKQGQDFLQSEDDKIRWFKKAAAQGYASAQTDLGFMFLTGRGVPRSEEEANEWFRKAAEQGYAAAHNMLGFIYFHKKDDPKFEKEAIEWFKSAAEKGYAAAQINLGFMYDIGQGVLQSDKEAIKWYRRAAEQENAATERKMGLIYDLGQDVIHSDEEAVTWYRRAAEQGYASAQYKLGFCITMGAIIFNQKKKLFSCTRKPQSKNTQMRNIIWD